MEESNNISELVRLYASNKNLFISGDLNVGLFLLSICIALATSSFVAFVYRYKHQGGFFQPSFQLSIICAALITTMVIYTIGGNLILSLGLVGALSIVRFRTAVKCARHHLHILVNRNWHGLCDPKFHNSSSRYRSDCYGNLWILIYR